MIRRWLSGRAARAQVNEGVAEPSKVSVMKSRILTLAIALVASSSTSSFAEAQDAAVVQRLVQNGQMPRDAARQLVDTVNRTLAEEAERNGEGFDSNLRRETHSALFGSGPPPRNEYRARLDATLDRLRNGLNVDLLTGLFPARRNAAVMCAHRYGVTIGECDALIAGATLTPSALPYLAPDDGSELLRALRGSRVPVRTAREIVTKLRETMLGVPRNLSRDARGRALIQLLEACPGGTDDRETQIRGWHVGPTEGLAQCIAGAVSRHGGADAAAQLFGMRPASARAFIEWGAPNAPPPIAVAPPPNMRRQPPRNPRGPQVSSVSAPQALRQQARAQFRLRNYPAALSAYEAAANLEPNHAGTWAGVAATRMAMNDYGAAVEAYQRAVSLDQDNAGYFVALGRAFARNGQNEAAVSALQQAMRIDPQNQAAREGLRALGGEAPAPPLPESPPRSAILATMQPLQGAVQGCAPNFAGQVSFHITIRGETGEVTNVTSDGTSNENDSACMESVVQSARFPRFTRAELSISYPFRLSGS